MRIVVLVLAAMFMAATAQAATVYLKNGSTASGVILERTADSVKMTVNGVTVTYYSDEIDRVDEGAAPAGGETLAERPTFNNKAAEMATPSSALTEPLGIVSAAKHDLIVKFMTVFGTKDAMKANFDQMAASLPADKAAAFKNAFRIDDIIELLVPLYDKYFSEEDLNTFINFYASAAGEKLIKTLPSVMKDSVEVSMKYFDKNMPAELREMEKEAEAQEAGAKK